MQAHLLIHRRVRPADAQTARRQREILRQHDGAGERVHVHRGGRFHRFGNRLEADPAPGVPAHRPAQQAHVQDVLYSGRVENGHHRADEFVFRPVRQGRAAAGMVVGGQCQHAAKRRGAGSIAVLEYVAAAVHARPFAVPHAVNALHFRAGEQVGLLGAPHHGGGKVLVQARSEGDLGRVQVFARPPQFQVQPAQRAAAVAADEAGGLQPGSVIAQALQQRQPHQRLHTGQVDAPIGARVLVVQRVVRIYPAELRRVGRVGRRKRSSTGHGVPEKGGWAPGACHLKLSDAPDGFQNGGAKCNSQLSRTCPCADAQPTRCG